MNENILRCKDRNNKSKFQTILRKLSKNPKNKFGERKAALAGMDIKKKNKKFRWVVRMRLASLQRGVGVV